MAALCVVAWAPDAGAFCRTRTTPISSDDCAAEGPSLYWKNQCAGYALNKAASAKADLDTARIIVFNSFAPWTAQNSICAPGVRGVELQPTDTSVARYDPKSSRNENVIVFRDTVWPYNDAGNPLALTTVTFNADTGEILDADIEVNTADPDTTAVEPLPANGYDLQSIITHEVGHFFGLAHSPVDGATMQPRYDRGQLGLRTLEQDDISGICTIYPTVEHRTTDKTGGTSPSTVSADACDTTPFSPRPSFSDKGCALGVGEARSTSSRGFLLFVGLAACSAILRRRRPPARH